MKRKFTKLMAALALLVFIAPPMVGWGQTRDNYNVTYNYSDLENMLDGNYVAVSGSTNYYRVPETAGNSATIAIPITLQPTSNITITFSIATYGSEAQPSSSNTTITAVGTEAGSNWSGSGVSTYPSSSSYVNAVMTITKPDSPTTLGGLTITMGVNSGVRIFRLKSITISYEYTPAAVATPTFLPVAGTYLSTQNVTISCTTDGASIHYTTDGTDPTSTSTLYEGAIPVSSNTTLKAKAFKDNDESLVASATYTILHAGTAADPFTVSDARVALNTTGLINAETDYYVRGIIAKKNSISSGKLTYWLSDDGSMTNNLQCYNGKYIDGVDFTEETDLEVGDIATVKGKLSIYSGSTYQFNADNQVVSITPRTKVNIATFTSTTNPLILGETTTTTTIVTNNQPDWTPAYSYESDNVSVATVNESGVVTAVAKGTANITVTPVVSPTDPTYKVGDSKSIEIIVNKPSHTASFSVNGAIDPANNVVVEEDYSITFPADPAAIGGKSFVGWVATPIEGTTDETPDLITSATMSTSNVIYYAVFANSASGTVTKTDELTLSTTGVSGNSYSSWTGKHATNDAHSDAVYSGCNAGGNSSIQLNASTSTSKRGIISTTSGGKLKKVTITWNSNTTNDRSVTVYGKNKAYTTMSAFNSDKGTSLGTITKGTSTELNITCDSTYVGFYATQAIYMDKISIDWETTGTVYSGYCTTIVLAIKEIEGYTTDENGWYLIASPVVSMTPTAANGFLTNTYDLFYFDQSQENEWVNYNGTEDPGFNLVAGKGYLYANSHNVTLEFVGMLYNGEDEFELDYDESSNLAGWNLVGNPFNAEVNVDRDFYRLGQDSRDLIPVTANEGTVDAMEGIIVKAAGEGEYVTFSPVSKSTANNNNNAFVVMNLSQNRGSLIDRAIVRFNESRQLPKFQIFENSTKLYIPQGTEEYAIVSAEAQGEMPVNFRANEDGTYTLTVSPENVEMSYLHLIDNMTGADIDLLATPSYTFNAKATDYESRFKLVFAANTAIEGSSNETFAFFANGQLIVSNEGEATLQVVDMMGRILSSETVNGSVSKAINQPAGIYMIRLINGNDVKSQKIVVR